MRYPLIWKWLILTTLLLTACSGRNAAMTASINTQSAPTATFSPTAAPAHSTMVLLPSTPSAVAGPASATPSACNGIVATQLLTRFVTAFNAGDQAALDRLFAPITGRYAFQWYSMTEGIPGSADYHNTRIDIRTELLPYFAERHAHGEQLHLREAGMSPVKDDPAKGAMLFTLTRTADDIPAGLGGPGHLATGKGTVDCVHRTIILMSVIMRQNPDTPAARPSSTPPQP